MEAKKLSFLEAPNKISRTAEIRAAAKANGQAAKALLTEFLSKTFEISVSDVQINRDQYSLNSLNGFFTSDDQPYFFKFHQEEGEEDMQGEYYRADLLAKENLPVDLPIWNSSEPGEQILVYKRRNDPRFADVLRGLEETPNEDTALKVVEAEGRLNEAILEVALRTLHQVDVADVTAEPIHHLFYERLVDPATGQSPGGRFKSFYVDKLFDFPDCQLTWEQLSTALLRLNGQVMAKSIGEIFDSALANLNPKHLTAAGGITAHGDAHNANVWYVEEGPKASLSYFDPAFAGCHIPSLLAEVKSTFHNVFAHPLWLYEPSLAQNRYAATAEYDGKTLSINTDWTLNPIRRALLDVKISAFWQPFLLHLAEKEMLPQNWQEIMRSAFAMCPSLVMDLRAGKIHNPTSSAIGFFMVGLAGSQPSAGENCFTGFFDSISPPHNKKSDA